MGLLTKSMKAVQSEPQSECPIYLIKSGLSVFKKRLKLLKVKKQM